MISLAIGLIGCLRDIRNALPLERPEIARKMSVDTSWSIRSLLATLVHRQLGVSDDLDLLE